MSCNNVQILNYNHSVVSLSSGNTLVITDNNRCNSITIPQPVTNILQINSPGPQGPPGEGANIDTGSFVTTSSFNDWTGSNLSQFAGTASYATSASYAFSSSYAFNSTTSSYVALSGLGITVNGTNLTASVRTVNGNEPDTITGNIVVPLSATKTGTSASLQASSSGANTGSLIDGTIWIISNNTPDSTKDGDTYIWSSASTQWYYIPKLDQTAGDARWLQLSGGTMTGNITMGSGISLLGTASYANTALSAPNYVLISATSSMLAPYATTGSNVFTGTQTITGSGQLVIKTIATSGVTLQTNDFSVSSGSGTNMFIGLGSSSGNTYASISSRTNGTSGTGSLSILSAGGRVAIGKTTFNATLDVNGNTIVTGSLNVTAGITGSLQGTSSYATTASYALNVLTIDTSSLLTTASFNSWTGSNNSQFAGTASYASQSLSASYATTASFVVLNGLGITVNGTNLTASIRTVNGNSPDAITGNITTALTATKTGTSASLIASSSGANTGSLTDGTVWIISNDPTASKNGDTYIWSSGTTQWYYIPKLDQTAGDARWLQLSGGTMSGNLTIPSGYSLIGSSSYATNASNATNALTASYITGSNVIGTVISASYAETASYVANASSFPYTGSAVITGSLNVIGPLDVNNGSITSQNINTSNIDVSSYGYGAISYVVDSINNNIQINPDNIILFASSGSNNNTFEINPTASISTVSITAPSFTGSLSGTASWAISSSYAISASYAPPQVIGNTGTSIYSITPAAGIVSLEDSIVIGRAASGDYRTVSIGYRAGGSSLSQTISSSVFIGDQAGYAANNASRSVFIGFRAGYGQGYNDYGSGDNCILIGNQAGAGGLVGTPYNSPIGSNNIIIGNNITVPLFTSNRLNIGGVIFATGITSGSVNLITPSSNAVNGNVGINEVNPQASLDVYGSVRFSSLGTSSISLTNVLMISSSGQLFITASSAIGGGSTVNTGSLLVTASAVSNVITFTKGDASTFDVTIATGSSGGVSFPYTGDAVISGSLTITGSGLAVSGAASFYNLPSSPSESIVPVGVSAGSIYRIGSNVKIVPGTDPFIAAPSVNGSEQSGYGIPAASVSSNTGVSTPYFRWYNASSGGTLLQEGYSNTYLQYITASTTFYVSEFVYGNNGKYGEGPRSLALTATVNQPDPVTVTPSTTLAATNTPFNLTMDYTSIQNYYSQYTITASPEAGSGITNPYVITDNYDYPAIIPITPTAPGTYTYTVVARDPDQGSYYLAAPVTITVATNATASYAVTASYAMNGGGASTTKAGSGSVASFGGSPLTSSITFSTPFTNNLYAVTVIGEDARPWTIQDKVSGSFVINSNSSVALTGPVYWVATPFNNP